MENMKKMPINEVVEVVLRELDLNNYNNWQPLGSFDRGIQTGTLYEDEKLSFECSVVFDDDELEVSIEGYYLFGDDSDSPFSKEDINLLKRAMADAAYKAIA